MAPKYATKDALLTYLRADPEPRPLVQIRNYMAVMHGMSRGAVCTELWRLCKAGKVRRTSPRWYQAVDDK